MQDGEIPTVVSQKPRILLVEDEIFVRGHLARVLSDEYIVETAGNGREALESVTRSPPALVVTDIVMPDLNGIGLLKALRNTESTRMIPVLLISGQAIQAQRIEGYKEGADGYLSKPYTEQELRACIGSMLQSAHRREEAARRAAIEQTERQAMAERAALLERITEQLREADERKNQFLAVLAHELRNPLAPLRNGLQILKLQSAAGAPISQTVSMMDRQMTHLVRLVDDLLDVSRITRGKLELRQRKLLLTEVLDSAVESTRAFIELHRHELNLDIRVRDLLVDADPDRLAQVFSNLLLNAAKYTDDGGRITLGLDQENGAAIVVVEDNGVGIPPQALERVFDMFSQLRSDDVRRAQGLGIGLSLVRTLVQMHNGSVHAFSEGLGRGARFTVRLPLTEGPVTPEVTAVPEGVRKRGQRVLVVDDNTDAAASLAQLLKMEDYEVCTAADGEEAIEQARIFEPQIVFMDVAMPRLNGLEAARRIRALRHGKPVRIVALTGLGQPADRQRSYDAGMDDHLTKPVSLHALHSVLRTLDPS
jgi:signal transduction histidine kinase